MLPLLLLSLPYAEYGRTLDQYSAWIAATPRLRTTTGTRSQATAVAIAVRDDTAYFLTADHIVRDAGGLQLDFFPRAEAVKPTLTLDRVQVLRQFRNPDFALLSAAIGREPVSVLPLAGPGQRPNRFPGQGHSLGFEHETPAVRIELILAKKLIRDGEKVAFFWELEQPSRPGRSGGPLIDASGRVIGIVAAAQENRGYAVHLDEILAGLKRENYGWLWGTSSGQK